MHPLLLRHTGLLWALFTTFSNTASLCPPAVGCALLSWSWGPNTWLFFFLHGHLARVSSTTQLLRCQLLPKSHGRRSIHGISSIPTSQASGTKKPLGRKEITIFHAQPECPLLCRCTDLWHLHSVDNIGLPCRNLQHLTLTPQTFSRASQWLTSYRTHRLSDAFDIMSFLTEVTYLISRTTTHRVPTPRHAHRCLQLHRETLLGAQRLPRHRIDMWTVIHGCRVKSFVFPAEVHRFIKHAPSPIINSTQSPRFSHTLSLWMSVSQNPGSQPQLWELTPSTHVPRGPHVCIWQSFCVFIIYQHFHKIENFSHHDTHHPTAPCHPNHPTQHPTTQHRTTEPPNHPTTQPPDPTPKRRDRLGPVSPS